MQDRRPRTEKALDDIDESIVWMLVNDGRASVTAIADALGISKSTATSRIQALRRRGVIRGVHADPDFNALGLTLQALVFIRLRSQAREHIAQYGQLVMKHPATVSAFHLGGGEDLIVHVSCTSTAHLQEVVETVLAAHPAVASTRTQIVFDWARGDANMGHLSGWGEVRETTTSYPSAFEPDPGR